MKDNCPQCRDLCDLNATLCTVIGMTEGEIRRGNIALIVLTILNVISAGAHILRSVL